MNEDYLMLQKTGVNVTLNSMLTMLEGRVIYFSSHLFISMFDDDNANFKKTLVNTC